jgi:hypothetical protein
MAGSISAIAFAVSTFSFFDLELSSFCMLVILTNRWHFDPSARAVGLTSFLFERRAECFLQTMRIIFLFWICRLRQIEEQADSRKPHIPQW